MSDDATDKNSDLSDVMLAMDVVDTLRHEQAVLERELGRDEHDRKLMEKVRRIYASQGIEVTESTIAEGVAALREERFAYRPPAPGLQHWLARLYVRRGAWVKRTVCAVIVLIAGYAVFQIAVVGPRNRGRQAAVQDLKLEISRQQDRIKLGRERIAALNRSLEDAAGRVPDPASIAARQLVGQARRSLESAQEKIDSLSSLAVDGSLDADGLGETGEVLKNRLARRDELIQGVETDLESAGRDVAAIADLDVLPGKLAGQRDSILREAKSGEARRQTEAVYEDAVAALNRGDVDAARQGGRRLQQLYDQVVQEYELRIVSRPGEPSGVWRTPEDKPGVRNYYLIVEAVTPRGETLIVPVTSEEDGKTRHVTAWGMRVDAGVFEAVRRDKQDDGIIDDRRFGVKRRGDLLPTYLMPAMGGAITEW